MPISKRAVIEGQLDSPIRKMFNLGQQLIKEGKHPIDVSLGNSFTETPPEGFYEAFEEQFIKAKTSRPSDRFHGYMLNPGFIEVRDKVASWLQEKNIFKDITGKEVLMTHGACGALNAVLKTLLEPISYYDQQTRTFEINAKGPDEIIIVAPYFVEYLSYIGNNQGKPVIVKSKDDFSIDVEAVENAITRRTKAIILNTPHNPTGVIYSEKNVKNLLEVLEKKQRELNTDIYTIEDIPYYDLNYTKEEVPLAAPYYRNSFIVYSWSKSLGLAGERIGFIAVNPDIKDGRDTVFFGLSRYSRNWYVNANAFMQRVIGSVIGTTIDVEWYREKRDKIYNKFIELDFKVTKPRGAFYFFPEIPDHFKNGEEFQKKALEGDDPLLSTPGIAFGKWYDRHIRFSYCIDSDTIERALNKLEKICKR